MVVCAAPGCKNRSIRKIPGISFHRFPTDHRRREEWVQALGRTNWTPSSNSFLCSAHFEEQYLDRSSPFVTRVTQNAVPTILVEVVENPKDEYIFLSEGQTEVELDAQAFLAESDVVRDVHQRAVNETTPKSASSSSCKLSAEETKNITEKPLSVERTQPLKTYPPKKLKTAPIREVSDDLKMVVVPKGYPEVKLIKDQHELLKDYILKKIREELDLQNIMKGPQFNECYHESGASVLNCANSYTKFWLQSIVQLMVQREDTALIIIDYQGYQNLIRRAKVRLCITGPMENCSTVEILEVLNHQNKGLCVEEWRVVERSVHERYTTLTMSIDEDSWSKLQENDLKAFLGLGQVFFIVLAKPMCK